MWPMHAATTPHRGGRGDVTHEKVEIAASVAKHEGVLALGVCDRQRRLIHLVWAVPCLCVGDGDARGVSPWHMPRWRGRASPTRKVQIYGAIRKNERGGIAHEALVRPRARVIDDDTAVVEGARPWPGEAVGGKNKKRGESTRQGEYKAEVLCAFNEHPAEGITSCS